MNRRTTLFFAALVSVVALSGSAFARGPAAPMSAEQPKTAEESKTAAQPKSEPAAQPAPSTPTAPKPETKPLPDFEFVKLSTSQGDIYLKLNRAKAPLSVENFMKYVDEKYYDGTIFHRVIKGFMIQGGGFTADMKQKATKAPIKNEWQNGLKNKKYSLAMARTQVPDSATSQFFINVADNNFLDLPRDGAAYAVFGEVVAGTDIVDKIQNVKTGTKGGMGDVPAETVTINSVTKITEDDAKKAGAK
jgi:peptidyl-prolyl cis-trans isomerase A (cyclophilin A)